ncbi:MAG: MBL fold metallo-hydrolase [Candidatus Nanohalobium sp.]
MMLKDGEDDNSARYLIGPSPDIREQIIGDFLDGIFVADNHLGDITGLIYLGESSMEADGVPVYCSEGIENFMMKNDPYRLLIDRENIVVNVVERKEKVELQGGSVETREVVHRGDYADAYSFMIHGEDKKLYYVSDLDKWNEDALKSVREADIAIVDGCFWTRDEIDRFEEVPHPPIKQSMDMMEDYDTEIIFTHLNHTNPALREESEERKEVEERGFKVAEKGMEIEL